MEVRTKSGLEGSWGEINHITGRKRIIEKRCFGKALVPQSTVEHDLSRCVPIFKKSRIRRLP